MRVEDESCQQHSALRLVVKPVLARVFEFGVAVVQVAAAGVDWGIRFQPLTFLQKLSKISKSTIASLMGMSYTGIKCLESRGHLNCTAASTITRKRFQ